MVISDASVVKPDETEAGRVKRQFYGKQNAQGYLPANTNGQVKQQGVYGQAGGQYGGQYGQNGLYGQGQYGQNPYAQNNQYGGQYGGQYGQPGFYYNSSPATGSRFGLWTLVLAIAATVFYF